MTANEYSALDLPAQQRTLQKNIQCEATLKKQIAIGDGREQLRVFQVAASKEVNWAEWLQYKLDAINGGDNGIHLK